jgi:GNAT superfamily N-acetyltransferase
MQQLTTPWLAQPSQQYNYEVTIRPIQTSDVGLIYDMHQRLSPDSLYYRYLQVRQPTLDEVAAICYMDPAKGAGFVATTHRHSEIVVGMAYYVREVHTQQPTAEPAILVEDGFQGQGIGRTLWQRMQQHAMDNKIQRLRVLFHRTNQRMARLVQHGGPPYQAQASDGLSEYLVTLGGLPLSLIPLSSLDRGSMGEGSRYYY